jgi:preprotein translocase subunit YajC
MGTPESTAMILAILVVVGILLFLAERRLQKKNKERRKGFRTDDDV